MLKERYHQLAVAAFLVGVGLITAAEISDRFGWATVFGATLITLSALGIGIWIGLLKPGRWHVPGWLKTRRVAVGLIGLVFLFFPVVLALLAGLLSLANGVDGTGWVYAVGVLILLLFIVVIADALIEGIGSIRSAGDLTRDTAGDES